MNFKKLGIKTIRPLATLEGGLNGTRFIAEVTKEDGKIELISVNPPDYDLSRAIPIKPYILESAIEKHNYIPVKHNPITNFENYEKYLQEINQPSKENNSF